FAVFARRVPAWMLTEPAWFDLMPKINWPGYAESWLVSPVIVIVWVQVGVVMIGNPPLDVGAGLFTVMTEPPGTLHGDNAPAGALLACPRDWTALMITGNLTFGLTVTV